MTLYRFLIVEYSTYLLALLFVSMHPIQNANTRFNVFTLEHILPLILYLHAYSILVIYVMNQHVKYSRYVLIMFTIYSYAHDVPVYSVGLAHVIIFLKICRNLSSTIVLCLISKQ